MPIIELPTLLRPFANQQARLTVEGQTVIEIVSKLIASYPELQKYLVTEQGNLNSFINIYLNSKDIRFLNQESTTVNHEDTLLIVPAVAGG